ncbi:MAG: hypothetical protein DRO95_02510 [Candidatus Altiarchaeales archaeon]|nr:MAG: hypothetical protein DRO95_02510 [Candidatus Altiarchaeales archaeon]
MSQTHLGKSIYSLKIKIKNMTIGDETFQKILVSQIKEMNGALARQKTLYELLGEERPHSITNSGHIYIFDKNVLMRVASLIPRFRYDELKLPIYLYVDLNVPDQYYINNELQAEVFKKLGNLGDGYQFRDGKLWIPRSIGRQIHRQYPTILQYFWLP